MKRFLPAFLILFCFSSAIYGIDEALYSTLLNVKYREGLMIVTFEPLEYKDVTYRIYRAQEPITTEAALISADFVAEIEEGQIPFYDSPVEDGKYAYAITIVKNEREHLKLIPFQNITVNPVDYAPFPEAVEKINIRQKGKEQVQVYFEPVNPDYTYNLYVSQKKVSEISDQNCVTTLQGENHFSVPIKEDVPYQFIVTVSNRLGIENKTIVRGKNTNSELYMIKSPKREKPVQRVKEKTNKELIEHNLKYNFYRGNYKTALNSFLSILRKRNLTDYERGLIHFYMGQCYYYLGKNSKAIKHFIMAKEVNEHRSKSEAWIERCLEN